MDGRWQMRAAGDPLLVALEFHADLVVMDSQVSIAAAHHRCRHDRLDLLRHHPDIELFLAVVGEAVKAKTVVESGQQDDVMLERDVGSPASAASAAAAAAKASAAAAPRMGEAAAAPRPAAEACLSTLRVGLRGAPGLDIKSAVT